MLRTLDKVGGLDEYLLGEKAARVKELGMEGWKLRWRIMQTEKVRERFRAQREALGLPPVEEVLVGANGQAASLEELEEEVRRFDQGLESGEEMGLGEGIENVGFMQEGQAGRTDKVEL